MRLADCGIFIDGIKQIIKVNVLIQISLTVGIIGVKIKDLY